MRSLNQQLFRMLGDKGTREQGIVMQNKSNHWGKLTLGPLSATLDGGQLPNFTGLLLGSRGY